MTCHGALDRSACAPFREERRMKFANATDLDRKSGDRPMKSSDLGELREWYDRDTI
jgi:hypothetical protein